MKKYILKTKFLMPVLLVVVFFTGTAFRNNLFEVAKQIEIFTTLYKEINMNYVDETNPAELMDTAIKNMLNELDPYTQFYNEQDVQTARLNQTNDFTGIGATVKTKKDRLIIVEPFRDMPADKAGLKAGDEIIKVDNITVADFNDDAGNLLEGAAGSTVNLTYLRQGKTENVTITRSGSADKAVTHYSLIDGNVGYIVLRKFNEKASAETINALRDLKNQGADKLILDLRGNPGGLLREAVNIVNIFVPQNTLVVTTKSKIKKYNQTYFTQREAFDTEIPVVVIIDDRSASASEIVSGALQDLDRGVIVGSRSFGKGLVQRPKPLNYGTQMKITISRYYTPSGRCIQALDYWNKDEQGKATRLSESQFTAYNTKNGRTVYDGGGVDPDEKLKESALTPISKTILENDFIFNYATQYYYKNKVTVLNDFKLSDADFNDFKQYLASNNFEFETQTEEAFLKALKKAKEEEMDAVVLNSYNQLKKDIEAYKNIAIEANKSQLMSLLTDEIITRYFYKEGLYKYYTVKNPEVAKAKAIVSNSSVYSKYLIP
ncbi:S41 family peptidase [Paucihalobacter ruber]|uniref:S41 family peptidase n=1 Tax=Paucihalobacter ruber TaxID=2567861 RepID=A0A506PM29_9FLAO|nr:S41 family peptidase [Paucihalobacter ruber]TPV34916.1 S41 family peptidase [Paucihalobacter ruber]